MSYEDETTDSPEIINKPNVHYDNREGTFYDGSSLFDGRGLPRTGTKYAKMVKELFKRDNSYEYLTVDQPEVTNNPKIYYDNREYTCFDGRGLPKTGTKYAKMVKELFTDDIFVDTFEYTTLGRLEIVSYRSSDIKDKLLFLEDGTCYAEVGKNSHSQNGIHTFTQDKIKGAIRGGNHMEDILLGYSYDIVLLQSGFETFEILVKGKKGKVGIMKQGELRSELLQRFKKSEEEIIKRSLQATFMYGD